MTAAIKNKIYYFIRCFRLQTKIEFVANEKVLTWNSLFTLEQDLQFRPFFIYSTDWDCLISEFMAMADDLLPSNTRPPYKARSSSISAPASTSLETVISPPSGNGTPENGTPNYSRRRPAARSQSARITGGRSVSCSMITIFFLCVSFILGSVVLLQTNKLQSKQNINFIA